MPAVATRPSCPPLSFSRVADDVARAALDPDAGARVADGHVVEVMSWPPIATPATRAPSIVEFAIVAPLVVFSTTIPRRPPVIVRFCSVTLVVFTCMNSPIGWSAVVTSRTTQSVHRLIRKPARAVAGRRDVVDLQPCVWPTTATP